MDANGTRFWMLLGEADWGDCTTPDGALLRDTWRSADAGDFTWNAERAELHLRPQVFRFTQGPQPTDLGLERRRGAARDRYGNWYWVDESGTAIRVWSAGSERASAFWPPPAPLAPAPSAPGAFHSVAAPPAPGPLRLRGLTVTADHYLVVGVLAASGNGGLLVFDLHAGGMPRHLRWPAGVPFAPYDLAPTPGGGLVALDRDGRRYWALDRNLRVIPAGQALAALPLVTLDFQPVAGGAAQTNAARGFPTGFDLGLASPPLPDDPIAIEALPDGSVLLLIDDPTRPFAHVARYRGGEPAGTASLAVIQREVADADGFTLRAYDMALVHGRPGGEHLLAVVGADGNQAYAFRLHVAHDELQLTAERTYLPMRLFSGRALVAAGGRVYYDIGERWTPLVAQARPRYAPQATLLTWVFDGRAPGCSWHRLMLDACLPPGATLRIWSCASDDPALLSPDDSAQRWQEEPRPYLRTTGSELPYVGPAPGAHEGTYELLLQQARGRYLQLRLLVEGGATTTPRLRALRVYYPRFSYLERYLPAVYREDARSASFLDRFLANLEGILTGIEDRIAAANLLIDLRSAPPEALEWLAHWFEVVLDPAWDERQRRLFVANAMTLFQWRGTARGILMALRLAFEPCAGETIFAPSGGQPARYRIVEQFRARRAPAVALGDPTEGGAPALVSAGAPWTPASGAADLERRYGAWLAARGHASDPQPPFPLRDPGGALSAAWQSFARATLGFVPPAAPDEDALWRAYLAATYGAVAALNERHGTSYTDFAAVVAPQTPPPNGPVADDWLRFTEGLAASPGTIDWLRWRAFLTRRYRRIRALNEVYGAAWPTFAAIPLPRVAPANGAALRDWHLFAGRVLPMHGTAHRFRVLLPNPQLAAGARAELQALQQEQLRLARRIVELEKPAHTEFSVRFYWAMFRVDEARLGDDTLLAASGRAALLAPPAVLNDVYLGETFLSPGHPLNVPDRLVVGRDRLAGQGAGPAPTESLFAAVPPPRRSHL